MYISQKCIKSCDFLVKMTASLLKENTSKSMCNFLMVFLKLWNLSNFVDKVPNDSSSIP